MNSYRIFIKFFFIIPDSVVCFGSIFKPRFRDYWDKPTQDLKTLRHTLLLYIQESDVLRHLVLPFLLYSQNLGIVFKGKTTESPIQWFEHLGSSVVWNMSLAMHAATDQHRWKQLHLLCCDECLLDLGHEDTWTLSLTPPLMWEGTR